MKVREIVVTALFAALICCLALIPAIPLSFSTVPFTLQVMGVFITGAVLGRKLGTIATCVYVAIGAAGLLVFAGYKGGLGVLTGPTGGYIFGFIIATYIIGWSTDAFYLQLHKKRFKVIFLCLTMMIGVIAIYVLGGLQLMLVAKLTLKKAIFVGVIPFLPFDLCKAGLAAFLTVAVRERLSKANLLKN
ncbi:MAG: biotin transporter BioY [Hyphomonadaceae bacterium]|nr:biotin transporter BioY [Clostridia bacterium]